MDQLMLENVGVHISGGDTIFVPGIAIIFLCPDCDSTHLNIQVGSRLAISLAMMPEQAEMIAEWLNNPRPLVFPGGSQDEED